jgi:hypothetical protein
MSIRIDNQIRTEIRRMATSGIRGLTRQAYKALNGRVRLMIEKGLEPNLLNRFDFALEIQMAKAIRQGVGPHGGIDHRVF